MKCKTCPVKLWWRASVAAGQCLNCRERAALGGSAPVVADEVDAPRVPDATDDVITTVWDAPYAGVLADGIGPTADLDPCSGNRPLEVCNMDGGGEKHAARGATVEGVGPDAPTVTNEHGGRQSASPYRADLLPAHAVLAVAAVLKRGADKYGANNWHATTVAENVNHALVHLLALAAGDESDDHLSHAATRILFALDQNASGREAALVAKGATGRDAPPADIDGFRVGDRVRHTFDGVFSTVVGLDPSKEYIYVKRDDGRTGAGPDRSWCATPGGLYRAG